MKFSFVAKDENSATAEFVLGPWRFPPRCPRPHRCRDCGRECTGRPAADEDEDPREGQAEGLTLKNKFLSDKDENLRVLGTSFVSNKIEANMENAVAMATNNEAGNGGDRKVANDTTTPGSAHETAGGKAGKKTNKKSAKAATSSAAGEAGADKTAVGTTVERWAQIWELLGSPDMNRDKANYESLKEMLGQVMALTAPVVPGPVCRNPNCGKPGHTLAVCPVPSNFHGGHMAGCFFCNVVDHEADNCPMMAWVSPAQLVTYLINNRAGLPPWKTRIDWVALANANWDLVCFTSLPLTRAFVKKVYIPGQLWEQVEGVSPLTDPLFKKADRKLLRTLGKKPTDGPRPRHPALMEATQDECYCCKQCDHSQTDQAVFKNEFIQDFIPDMQPDEETTRRAEEERERALAVSERQINKQMPKKVTKERKGRRAMKKDALAAAAAAAEAEKGQAEGVAGPSNANKSAAPENKGQAADKKEAESEDEKDDRPLSERMLDCLDMAEEICDVFDKLQGIVKS